jgi:hypothetical protein
MGALAMFTPYFNRSIFLVGEKHIEALSAIQTAVFVVWHTFLLIRRYIIYGNPNLITAKRAVGIIKYTHY